MAATNLLTADPGPPVDGLQIRMDIQFQFSSVLPVEYLEDLEALMFFNAQQPLARTEIMQSLDTYGRPGICVNGELLRVTVGALTDVQMLCALADSDDSYELAGVVLYFRTTIEDILVLHIAVTEPFSSTGPHSAALLVVRLLHAVRDLARQLKGMRTITVMYHHGRTLKMTVRPGERRIVTGLGIQAASLQLIGPGNRRSTN
jgi:hypothetical protein